MFLWQLINCFSSYQTGVIGVRCCWNFQSINMQFQLAETYYFYRLAMKHKSSKLPPPSQFKMKFQKWLEEKKKKKPWRVRQISVSHRSYYFYQQTSSWANCYNQPPHNMYLRVWHTLVKSCNTLHCTTHLLPLNRFLTFEITSLELWDLALQAVHRILKIICLSQGSKLKLPGVLNSVKKKTNIHLIESEVMRILFALVQCCVFVVLIFHLITWKLFCA